MVTFQSPGSGKKWELNRKGGVRGGGGGLEERRKESGKKGKGSPYCAYNCVFLFFFSLNYLLCVRCACGGEVGGQFCRVLTQVSVAEFRPRGLLQILPPRHLLNPV